MKQNIITMMNISKYRQESRQELNGLLGHVHFLLHLLLMHCFTHTDLNHQTNQVHLYFMKRLK